MFWNAATLRCTTFVVLTVCSATACADSPMLPAGSIGADLVSASGKVDVCHVTDAQPAILSVSQAALPAHLRHGDYVTTLLVDRRTDQLGDGMHFRRIGDALNAARVGRLARGELLAGACRITIVVSADVYPGSAAPTSPDLEQFPFIVDVPDITLRGALVMNVDASGRATGSNPDLGETVLTPTDPLPVIDGSSTPIIEVNAHPDGSAGHGLTVEGFVFESGHDPLVDAGGQGVLSVRAERVTIRGNRFEAGFTESLDLRAGSVGASQNVLGGTAGTCDICLAGPGRFTATGNRLAAGGIPGIVVSGVVGLPVPSGVEPIVLPDAAETWAEVRNNEVRDHQRVPVGVGIRVDALGVMAPNVHNTVHAVIQDNALINNRFGIIVHAAFPVKGSALRSDVDVTLGGNTIAESCEAKLLVSLSRHTTALGLTSNPYLINSIFQLQLNGNLNWDDAWYGDPAGYGNALIVDGQPIANGARQFYSATGCPGL